MISLARALVTVAAAAILAESALAQSAKDFRGASLDEGPRA
jgi:hypothetical protein